MSKAKVFYLASTSINTELSDALKDKDILRLKRLNEMQNYLHKNVDFENAYRAIYGWNWQKEVPFKKLARIGKEIKTTNDFRKVDVRKRCNSIVTYKVNRLNNNYITRYIEKEYGKKVREEIGWIDEYAYRELVCRVKSLKNFDVDKRVKENLLKCLSSYRVSCIVQGYEDTKKVLGKEIAKEMVDNRVRIADLINEFNKDDKCASKYGYEEYMYTYLPGVNYGGHYTIGKYFEKDNRKIHALEIMNEFELAKDFIICNTLHNDVNGKLYSILKAYDKAYKRNKDEYEFLRNELVSEIKELNYLHAYKRCYTKVKLVER